MANKDICTLDDFTNYAQINFPVAFKIIPNPSIYTFHSRQFLTDENKLIEAGLLQFASWNGPFFGIPAWAYFDGNTVQYYYGKSGADLKPCAPPIASGGKKSPIQDLEIPFCFAAARTEPGSNTKNFVFILTGRVAHIQNEEDADLLVQFKELCTYIQQKKATMEVPQQPTIVPGLDLRASTSTAGDSVDTRANGQDIAETEHTPPASCERKISEPASVAIRGSKRAASDDNTSVTDAGIKIIHKRTKTAPSLPHQHASTTNAHQPSPQLQSMFDTLVEECKTEAEARWAREKAASQESILALEAQLVGKDRETTKLQQRVDELEGKYQKLRDKVSRQMGDD